MRAAPYTFAIILSLWIATSTHAQNGTPLETDLDPTEFTPVPSASLPIPDADIQVSGRTSVISITLDDVELIDVVRMFGRIANANIIANPEILTARVTVNLDNVEWRAALSSILSMHQLSLLERPQGSGVFIITEQMPDAPIPMIVETVFLKYTTVDEVRPVVERMLGGGPYPSSLLATPW